MWHVGFPASVAGKTCQLRFSRRKSAFILAEQGLFEPVLGDCHSMWQLCQALSIQDLETKTASVPKPCAATSASSHHNREHSEKHLESTFFLCFRKGESRKNDRSHRFFEQKCRRSEQFSRA